MLLCATLVQTGPRSHEWKIQGRAGDWRAMSAGLHWTEAKLGGTAQCTRFSEIMHKFCPDRRKLSVSYVSLFLGKANVTVSCFSWQRIVGCRISKSKPCLLQSASWEYYFRKDCQLCKVLRKFCTQRTFWLLQLKRNSSKMLSQETGWRWQTIQNTRQVRNTATTTTTTT